MRGRTLASIVTLGSSGVFLTACGASNDCAGNGTCPPEPGWVCTPDDGGVANCYPPDGSVSDGGEDGGQDATVPSDAGHDAGRDAAQDTSVSDAGSDGSVGDGGGDAAQDSGYDAALTCDGGFTPCNGSCVALTTVSHCGACGTSCTQAPDGGEPACVESDAGAYGCAFVCNSGEHQCGAACFPNTDPPGVTGDTCVVSPTYGVFVAPTPAGSDANDAGTPTSPFATVGAAAAYAKAHGLRDLFVCGGTYGAISLDAAVIDGINVFGGLQCSNWTYNASAVAFVDAGNAGPALSLSGLTVGTMFADFGFYSGNATSPGGSSVAVFAANSANVAFERCTMTAGSGMSAAPVSVVPPNYTAVTAPTGGNPTGADGGSGGMNTCLLLGASQGGAGGDGTTGGDGGTGTATPAASASGIHNGFGGAGGGASTNCSIGNSGANGAPGSTPASGASRWGTLTASGWIPQSGDNGSAGNPGQGGGGGGGNLSDLTGGGGGGAGGCGGAGAPGGGGGGSSFALLSFDSTVFLDHCTLAAGSGGSGASGVLGQIGQSGGASGVSNDCSGSHGGNGAGGGSSGGGAGGLSAAIGYLGTMPDAGPSNALTPLSGGMGGSGQITGALGGTGGGTTADAGMPSTPGIDGGAFTTVNLQ